MRTRVHQGLELSEIGIGCYALSGAYGHKDPARFKDLLIRAYELGVTFFDTADAYGDAESILGEVVAPFREEILIATKVGVKEQDKPDLSADYLRSACEGSLRRLDTDYIDLYQVHFDDPDTPVSETVAALEALAAQGKIRRYGLGHLSPKRMETHLQHGRPFSVLMELNTLAQESYRDLLPLCREHNAGIIAFSITGRGLLTGKFMESPSFEEDDIRSIDPLFQRERFQFGIKVMEKLAEVGKRHGKTPAQTAIAWVLSQTGVVCALTGPSSISHLEENLGGSGWELTSGDLGEIDRFIDREKANANQRAREHVKEILTQPLPEDPKSAFKDLIYAIETAIRLRLVGESDVMPTFYKLYHLRKNLDADPAQKLLAIQGRLDDLIRGEDP